MSSTPPFPYSSALQHLPPLPSSRASSQTSQEYSSFSLPLDVLRSLDSTSDSDDEAKPELPTSYSAVVAGSVHPSSAGGYFGSSSRLLIDPQRSSPSPPSVAAESVFDRTSPGLSPYSRGLKEAPQLASPPHHMTMGGRATELLSPASIIGFSPSAAARGKEAHGGSYAIKIVTPSNRSIHGVHATDKNDGIVASTTPLPQPPAGATFVAIAHSRVHSPSSDDLDDKRDLFAGFSGPPNLLRANRSPPHMQGELGDDGDDIISYISKQKVVVDQSGALWGQFGAPEFQHSSHLPPAPSTKHPRAVERDIDRSTSLQSDYCSTDEELDVHLEDARRRSPSPTIPQQHSYYAAQSSRNASPTANGASPQSRPPAKLTCAPGFEDYVPNVASATSELWEKDYSRNFTAAVYGTTPHAPSRGASPPTIFEVLRKHDGDDSEGYHNFEHPVEANDERRAGTHSHLAVDTNMHGELLGVSEDLTRMNFAPRAIPGWSSASNASVTSSFTPSPTRGKNGDAQGRELDAWAAAEAFNPLKSLPFSPNSRVSVPPSPSITQAYPFNSPSSSYRSAFGSGTSTPSSVPGTPSRGAFEVGTPGRSSTRYEVQSPAHGAYSMFSNSMPPGQSQSVPSTPCTRLNNDANVTAHSTANSPISATRQTLFEQQHHQHHQQQQQQLRLQQSLAAAPQYGGAGRGMYPNDLYNQEHGHQASSQYYAVHQQDSYGNSYVENPCEVSNYHSNDACYSMSSMQGGDYLISQSAPTTPARALPSFQQQSLASRQEEQTRVVAAMTQAASSLGGRSGINPLSTPYYPDQQKQQMMQMQQNISSLRPYPLQVGSPTGNNASRSPSPPMDPSFNAAANMIQPGPRNSPIHFASPTTDKAKTPPPSISPVPRSESRVASPIPSGFVKRISEDDEDAEPSFYRAGSTAHYQPTQISDPIISAASMQSLPPPPPPKNVYTVRFKRLSRPYILCRSPSSPFGDKDELKIGTYVRVEADRGEDLGCITAKITAEKHNNSIGAGRRNESQGSIVAADLKKITRVATQAECNQMNEKTKEEETLLKLCRTKVKQRSLPMNVIDSEFQFDRHKLTFFFEAEGRIDFRELVRDLFSVSKTRIWMQQLDGGSASDRASNNNAGPYTSE